VRDRIKEAPRISHVVVALSGTFLAALPTIIGIATGHSGLNPWPGTGSSTNLVTAILHAVYVLSLVIRGVVPLFDSFDTFDQSQDFNLRHFHWILCGTRSHWGVFAEDGIFQV